MRALIRLYKSTGWSHYENTPIQIYWKFCHQKMKISDKKFWHFSYFCSKHRLWVLARIVSNEYPQSMFLSRNKKNNVYPCEPQFYCIKRGLRGSKLYRHVIVMWVSAVRVFSKGIFFHALYIPLSGLIQQTTVMFFLFFTEKRFRQFMQIVMRQFAWNVKTCFLGKIRK